MSRSGEAEGKHGNLANVTYRPQMIERHE